MLPQFTLHLRTTPQAITIAINYGYPDIRSLPATTGTQKPSDLYNSPGRSMHRRLFPPDIPKRMVAGSDLFRAQVVINGGDAAEKVVFFLKDEIYVNYFIHFIHYLFRAYMQEMVLILQVSGSFLQ